MWCGHIYIMYLGCDVVWPSNGPQAPLSNARIRTVRALLCVLGTSSSRRHTTTETETDRTTKQAALTLAHSGTSSGRNRPSVDCAISRCSCARSSRACRAISDGVVASFGFSYISYYIIEWSSLYSVLRTRRGAFVREKAKSAYSQAHVHTLRAS